MLVQRIQDKDARRVSKCGTQIRLELGDFLFKGLSKHIYIQLYSNKRIYERTYFSSAIFLTVVNFVTNIVINVTIDAVTEILTPTRPT